jgi:hypothetical protein
MTITNVVHVSKPDVAARLRDAPDRENASARGLRATG